jgi:hypothetical protein
VWEWWKAGVMAFHAFHNPAFPRLVLVNWLCVSNHIAERSSNAVQKPEGRENHGK